MGFSTFMVGLLPSYAQIGWIAPVVLILLRMAQGLALGGEYGGAAVYVAEHAPVGRRGFYTSWIQTTATVGLLLSLVVILSLRLWMGEAASRPARVTRSRAGASRSCSRRAARHLGLDSSPDEREPGLPEDEGRGHPVQGAALGSLRPVEER
jgi:hypothetical protein